jgi:hypothetical protein
MNRPVSENVPWDAASAEHRDPAPLLCPNPALGMEGTGVYSFAEFARLAFATIPHLHLRVRCGRMRMRKPVRWHGHLYNVRN